MTDTRGLLKNILSASAVAAAAMAVLPGSAMADERICRGTIGAIVVDGDVRVANGAACVLKGTTVKGNVLVGKNARLNATGAKINGNVQAENHTHVVVLASSTVGGSVQLKQGGSARIENVRVNGDVQLFSNKGTQVVKANRIGGNLQCKSNQPAPTGGNNVVGGNKEDQCRRL